MNTKRSFKLLSMTSDLISKAKAFAIKAHDSIGHKRKFTDEPYHVHCERVANIVAGVTTDPEMIAAAWMHDVLEDVAPNNAEFNADAIGTLFGDRVKQLVLELTDISKLSDGNRQTRKAIDRKHSAEASPQGKTIKLADLIDNCLDIAKHDHGFYRYFREEAILLLPALKEGDAELYARLDRLLKSPSEKT